MIYLGCDHGGFTLKEQIKQWLKDNKIQFTDSGALTLDPNDDYPQYAINVASQVAKNPEDKGILFCRSAAGMVIAANKVKGIRAVACFDTLQAKHSREHNDANVLGISGDWTDLEKAKEIINAFINTSFSNEPRHIKRIEMINNY